MPTNTEADCGKGESSVSRNRPEGVYVARRSVRLCRAFRSRALDAHRLSFDEVRRTFKDADSVEGYVSLILGTTGTGL